MNIEDTNHSVSCNMQLQVLHTRLLIVNDARPQTPINYAQIFQITLLILLLENENTRKLVLYKKCNVKIHLDFLFLLAKTFKETC